MISAKSIAAIDWLFEKSVVDHCVADEQGSCTTKLSHGVPATQESADRHLVALNISSYQFRIACLFDFDTGQPAAAYLARLSRSTQPILAGQALHDAYAELVNMVCGAVNRGLHGALLHTGMSTPNVLDRSCRRYINLLAPAHVSHIEVVIEPALSFGLTLCVCLAPKAELDFDIERHAAAEVSSGEIELF